MIALLRVMQREASVITKLLRIITSLLHLVLLLLIIIYFSLLNLQMVTVTIDSGTSESMATRLPDKAPRATDDSDDSDPR